MISSDFVSAIIPVINAFDRLIIPYYIGGSIASSIHGLARATADVDVVAAIKSEHIVPLYQELHQDYYINENLISNAIRKSIA